MDFEALLIIIAIVCFVVAAIPTFPLKWNWIAIGLAFLSAGHIWTRLSINIE